MVKGHPGAMRGVGGFAMICHRSAEPFLLKGKIGRTLILRERKPQNGRRISQLVHHRPTNVRYWHKADIDFDAEHVCFRGQSGHP
jgi:hypothetical protein